MIIILKSALTWLKETQSEKTGKHKQVMSAIVTTVLRGTIGLLLKKGRQSASKKLRDGDVADEQLRSWIVDEMDNVNSKLDAMARKDLGASSPISSKA